MEGKLKRKISYFQTKSGVLWVAEFGVTLLPEIIFAGHDPPKMISQRLHND